MKDWIFNEAVNLLHEGEKAKAAQIIAKYIKRYPHDVQAWLLLSDALDDPKKIEFSINKALEIDPTNEIALEKFKELKNQEKEKTNFFDSPFIDFDSNLEPNQSESFVYTPDYDIPEEKPEQPIVEEKTPEKETEKNKKPKNSKNQEPVNKFVGTFFLIILLLGLFTAIYITKSIWVPRLIPYLNPPLQIYFETFEENRNISQIGNEFRQASTEVANYMNPTPTPILTPTPLPTLTNNEIVANQIKSQVDQLKLLNDIASPGLSVINAEEMQEKLSMSYTDDEIETIIKVWIALGWIEPTFDLNAYFNAQQSLQNATYDSQEKQIYISDPNFSLQTQSDYAYAYVTYLQTFGVMTRPAISAMTFDQATTSKAFYDGDARYSQLLVEQILADSSQFKTDDFNYTNWSIPPALFAQSNFSSQYGVAFIDSIYQNGQMIGIQSAYSNPPQTTEQIMHIDKYYSKELGINIPAPDMNNELGTNWVLVSTDSIGEWGTYQILHNNSKASARIDDIFAQNASTGWGGDRYQLFENQETAETLLIMQWIMDSDTDAYELITALNQSNSGRFTYGKTTIYGTVCNTQTPYTSCVFGNDRHVLWIVSPDETLIPSIIERYPSIQ